MTHGIQSSLLWYNERGDILTKAGALLTETQALMTEQFSLQINISVVVKQMADPPVMPLVLPVTVRSRHVLKCI